MSCLDSSLVQTLGPRLLLWLRPKETGGVPTIQTRLLLSQSQEWSYAGASSSASQPSNQHQRQRVENTNTLSSQGQQLWPGARGEETSCSWLICLGWSCYCAEQREEKHVSKGGLWGQGGERCLSSNIMGSLSLFLLTKFPSTNVSPFAVPSGPFLESCFEAFS